jgi:hypothetical protein
MMTPNEMLTRYNAHSAAHTYALGFTWRECLYVTKLTFEEIAKYAKLTRASSAKGGHAKLRIKLTAEDRATLSASAEKLGTADLLTMDTAHNRGENLEKILTERWVGGTWVKDSTPFWVAGDLRVNGEEIQVKLDGAELTNEKVLSHLAAGLC